MLKKESQVNESRARATLYSGRRIMGRGREAILAKMNQHLAEHEELARDLYDATLPLLVNTTFVAHVLFRHEYQYFFALTGEQWTASRLKRLAKAVDEKNEGINTEDLLNVTVIGATAISDLEGNTVGVGIQLEDRGMPDYDTSLTFNVEREQMMSRIAAQTRVEFDRRITDRAYEPTVPLIEFPANASFPRESFVDELMGLADAAIQNGKRSLDFHELNTQKVNVVPQLVSIN